MAQQASQDLYVKDPAFEHWFVTIHGKDNLNVNEENLSNLNIDDTHPFKRTINVDEVPLVDVVHAI